MSAERLDGKCGGCGHVFLVAYLPMELAKVARLAKRAGCPSCGAVHGIRVAGAAAGASPSPEQSEKRSSL